MLGETLNKADANDAVDLAAVTGFYKAVWQFLTIMN